jgi:RNA polymerase sigma-70 factor (ECF subfamily)
MKMHETGRQGEAENDRSDILAEEYLQYRGALMNYCGYVTGDRETAREIVQESFLRLAGKIKESRTPASTKDWLFICVRNLCFKFLKSNKTKAAYLPLLEHTLEENSVEDRRFIQEVLGRMKAEDRDLILLREVEQYSISEIANLTKISEGAVRTRLHRIRKKMQELGRK